MKTTGIGDDLDALWDAARRNELERVKQKIDGAGVHVDEVNDLGETALHVAVSHGSYAVMNYLLKRGADVHRQDWESGYTPLHRALFKQDLVAALALLIHGAFLGDKIHIEDENMGRNMHHKAKFISNRHGPGRDNEGFTPYELVCENLSGHIKEVLSRKYRGGDVMVFGKNDYQIGVVLSQSMDVIGAKMLHSLDEELLIDIGASQYHSAAVTSRGVLYTWGHGKGGRLGHGDFGTCVLPTVVKSLQGHKVVRVATGTHHTLALTMDGYVYSWGNDQYGQCGHQRPIADGITTPRRIESVKDVSFRDIAAGTFHSLASSSAGEIYAWGLNNNRQLGYESLVTGENVQFSGCPTKIIIRGTNYQRRAISLEATEFTSVARVYANKQENGKIVHYEVYQWGHGHSMPSRVQFYEDPKKSTKGRGESIIHVSASEYYNGAVSFAGHIFVWTIGNKKTKECPHRVDHLIPAKWGKPAKVSCCERGLYVVTDRGNLWEMKFKNRSLQFREGPSNVAVSPINDVKRAFAIVNGKSHTMVLVRNSDPGLRLRKTPGGLDVESSDDDGDGDGDGDGDEEDDEEEDEEDADASFLSTSTAITDNGNCLAGIDTEVSTLSEICERIIAKEIDIKNIWSVHAFADAIGAETLRAQCEQFLRNNLDVILSGWSKPKKQGTMKEWLNEIHPEEDWSESPVELDGDHLGAVCSSRHASPSTSYGGASGFMSLSELRMRVDSVDRARRMLRSTKKKIGKIRELEWKLERGEVDLKEEHMRRLTRKDGLEVEVQNLGVLLKELEMRENQLNRSASRKEDSPRSDRKSSCDSYSTNRQMSWDSTDSNSIQTLRSASLPDECSSNEPIHPVVGYGDESRDGESGKGGRFWSSGKQQGTAGAESPPNRNFCQLCRLFRSDDTAWKAHVEGKAHQSHLASSRPSKNGKASSESSIDGKTDTTERVTKAEARSDSWSDHIRQSSSSSNQPAATKKPTSPVDFRKIQEDEERISNAAKRDAFVRLMPLSPKSSKRAPAPRLEGDTESKSEPTKRTLSLSEFMSPRKASNPSQCPWSSPRKSSESTQCQIPRKISFSEIQREEEMIAQNSKPIYEGSGDCAWYIHRHRSSSLEKIQKEQEEEAEREAAIEKVQLLEAREAEAAKLAKAKEESMAAKKKMSQRRSCDPSKRSSHRSLNKAKTGKGASIRDGHWDNGASSTARNHDGDDDGRKMSKESEEKKSRKRRRNKKSSTSNASRAASGRNSCASETDQVKPPDVIENVIS